jgi:very-short-patch-repair endonuclease
MVRTRYSPTFIARSAQSMRSRMTTAQGLLWTRLSQGFDGGWFRRQYPIGNHVVDFYCRKLKLIVEIGVCRKQDERHHNAHLRDESVRDAYLRDAYLRTCGYTVLRFSEKEIIDDFPRVISRIRLCVRIVRIRTHVTAFIGFFRGCNKVMRSFCNPKRRFRPKPRPALSLLMEF